ncbi:DivIVA domain-containing protein [Allokutzneria albata]|uniref:Cell wall synthesis protein Wag31 n=1 Tax=Allokutzneria albata TaxID=211114 RepID=A0A1G9R5S4_ALLAB|nr:DivIVA domain-containing protein [Allokutzneria albata]SDM18662.1 DivIVA domain-containing protein [Allokutzneria albata]
MTATAESGLDADFVEADPVPLGRRFDTVWRGYDRAQVDEYVETELRLLAEDRDGAMALVNNLARLVDASRAEILELRAQRDRLCRTPIPDDAVDERLRRLVDAAWREAADIVAHAHAIAEQTRTTAEEECRRLAEDAERRRRRVEEDFVMAMALRRKQALRALRDHEARCRALADERLRDATREAERRVAAATTQVELLREMHRNLAVRLRVVHRMFTQVYAALDAI